MLSHEIITHIPRNADTAAAFYRMAATTPSMVHPRGRISNPKRGNCRSRIICGLNRLTT
jgi:hypothetical protein